jgi:Zn-dependent protease
MARLGRNLHLFGIPLSIHPSWLLTIALLVVGIGHALPTDEERTRLFDLPAAAYLGGLAVALGLFASVLVHELAHALVARRYGLPVRRINLYFFGGTAEIDAEALDAPGEAIVAVAGPVLSLVLAAGCGASWWFVRDSGWPARTLAFLALANAGVALFTLLPGYPLDGGRLVHAGLWYLTDNLLLATRLAALYGQALGWALLAGAVVLLVLDQPLWAGGLALGGWLLRAEARRGYRDMLWHDLSRHTPVVEVAWLKPASIPAGQSLDEAVDAVLDSLGTHDEGGPSWVVDERGQPCGVLGIAQLRAVKRSRWAATTAGEAMVPLAALPVLLPDLPLAAALATLAADRYSYALVAGADGAVPVGIVTPGRIERFLVHAAWPRHDD